MSVFCYLALLHTPVLNRRKETVTTSVTNLDIHDIARSARTYGVQKYFIVTPIEDQHELVGRVLDHWQASSLTHPDRVEALSRVHRVKTFEAVKAWIQAAHQQEPEVVLTDARPLPKAVAYADYRKRLRQPDCPPILLVFGTGWGVAESFYPQVHRFLEPVYGPEGASGYNHLSVRAAVAVILDRLLGA